MQADAILFSEKRKGLFIRAGAFNRINTFFYILADDHGQAEAGVSLLLTPAGKQKTGEVFLTKKKKTDRKKIATNNFTCFTL